MHHTADFELRSKIPDRRLLTSSRLINVYNWQCFVKTTGFSLSLSSSTIIVRLAAAIVIKIPRPRTQHTHTSLFGSIHKTVSGIGMKARYIHIIVTRQRCGHVRHATAHAKDGRNGMKAAGSFNDGLAHAVTNQTKVSRGRKFDTGDGSRLVCV